MVWNTGKKWTWVHDPHLTTPGFLYPRQVFETHNLSYIRKVFEILIPSSNVTLARFDYMPFNEALEYYSDLYSGINSKSFVYILA